MGATVASPYSLCNFRRYDMGLFSFIKEAGEKLFGGKDAQAAPAATACG